MRNLVTILICFLLFLPAAIYAQNVYTITADSVKLTSCDSSELIIENHTQAVPGFLFNTGRGRTIFKRGLQQLTSGSYIIGADTLNAWIQGGNKFGTTGILGTFDNNPLDLYSNSAQRLRFTPAGRTLFGTTFDNGYNNFQFNGSILDSTGYYTNFSAPLIGGNNSGAIRLRWGTGDGSYLSFFYQGSVSRRAFIGSASDTRPFDIYDQVGVSFLTSPYVSVGSEGTLNARFSVTNSNPLYNDMTVARFSTTTDSFYYDFAITPVGHTVVGGVGDNGNMLQVNGTSNFTGNMGIGTPYPTAQLHATGSVRFAGLTQDSTKTNVLVSDANGNLYYRSASSIAADDLLRTSLAVNGPITAKKLTLHDDTNWPDYVFDSAYHLTPLNEVDSYIQKEHHLPGIPAAAEIQKQGLDVGANQTALLKKIEELTLYNIDQSKKLDEQNKKLASQDQQLADQKAKIESLQLEIEQIMQTLHQKKTTK